MYSSMKTVFRGFTIVMVLSTILMLPSMSRAADQTSVSVQHSFSDSQRGEIEQIIKEYLSKKNPEVLVEAMKELQQREQSTAEAKTKDAVSQFHDKIMNDPETPTSGNPKGDITIVEFYDYQCGYCKMTEEAVRKVMHEDKNIRLVYKNYPILGQVSVIASRAALASVRQNKFVAFHEALMDKKEHLTEPMIYDVAKSVGIDVEKLKKDMNDDKVSKAIDDNMKLGNDVGVRGTPMFVINDQIYPGAMQYDQMKSAVKDVRAKEQKS